MIRPKEKFACLVLPFALAVGAFAQASQAGSPSGKAKVYLYRYKQYVGKAIRPSVSCDEKDVARIQNGRMVVLALNPGKHVLRSNDAQSQVELDLKPGQDYYVRVEIATGFWKGHGRLTFVAPEQGAAEIKQMKPADKGMIKDSELLAPDFAPTK